MIEVLLVFIIAFAVSSIALIIMNIKGGTKNEEIMNLNSHIIYLETLLEFLKGDVEEYSEEIKELKIKSRKLEDNIFYNEHGI